jgi:uncharacterized protein (DUF58 family)
MKRWQKRFAAASPYPDRGALMSSILMSQEDPRTTRPGPILLTQRHIYILPSRFGVMFCAILIVMLLGSINYSSSLGHALTFLLGGVLLVGLLHTYFNLARLQVTAGRVDAVFAGEVACFQMIVSNNAETARCAIQGDVIIDSRGWRRQVSRLRLIPPPAIIPAHGRTLIKLPMVAQRRGRLSLGQIRLSSSYPLGLFNAWSNVGLDRECVVYPRPIYELPLPLRGGSDDSGGAGQQKGLDDFSGFRKYIPGDSPRHINWKAVARGQDPLIKHFTGAGAGRIELSLLQLAAWRDLEARLSQLCGWILECDGRGLAYDLVLDSERLEYRPDSDHRDRCLRALADYR